MSTAIVALRQLPPPAEIKEFGWVQGDPPIKTIRSDEGFCFLSGIAGKFEGGGEILSVYPGDGGWWYFDAISNQVMGGRSLSVQTDYRKLFKTEVQMFEWSPKNPPVKMIPRHEGFCLLSLIKGKFESATDEIGVAVAPDGNWYLAGRTSNFVQAKARSAELIDPGASQVKITEYRWAAGVACPSSDLRASGFQHPVAQGQNQSCLLSQGDELIWRDDTAPWVVPTQ